MTKAEQREVRKLTLYADNTIGVPANSPEVAILARSFSALIRSSRGSRNEIITVAADYPVVVQHAEFII